MVSLKATVRHQVILGMVRDKGRASIAQLAERLGVSGVTVREDLKFLEGQRRLVRTRGGAVSQPDQRIEMPLELTSLANAAEKRAIGCRAASMVQSGQTIIIDVGSTTSEMAKALPAHLLDVVVITNGLNIALLLEGRPGVSVVVTGGTLRPLQHSLVAPLGTVLLEKLNADVAFLGCNGVEAGRGFTNTNLAEAEIKQAMVKSARRVVFLADHSKLNTVASAFVARLDQADRLITDDGAPTAVLSELRHAGLQVDAAATGQGR
jgi:DeoR/GlpR family transcriptional regulator of sugar metabolism